MRTTAGSYPPAASIGSRKLVLRPRRGGDSLTPCLLNGPRTRRDSSAQIIENEREVNRHGQRTRASALSWLGTDHLRSGPRSVRRRADAAAPFASPSTRPPGSDGGISLDNTVPGDSADQPGTRPRGPDRQPVHARGHEPRSGADGCARQPTSSARSARTSPCGLAGHRGRPTARPVGSTASSSPLTMHDGDVADGRRPRAGHRRGRRRQGPHHLRVGSEAETGQGSRGTPRRRPRPRTPRNRSTSKQGHSKQSSSKQSPSKQGSPKQRTSQHREKQQS